MTTPQVAIEGDTLTIVIDVSKRAYDMATTSKTGKSKMIASTNGFLKLESSHGPVQLSLNLIRPL